MRDMWNASGMKKVDVFESLNGNLDADARIMLNCKSKK